MRIGFWYLLIDEGIHPVELGRALEERGAESLFVGEHTNLPVDTTSRCPASSTSTTIPAWPSR